MTGETLELVGINRVNNDNALVKKKKNPKTPKTHMFNRRKSDSNILGEIGHVPKIRSNKNPAGPPILPPLLRRLEHEPALPTFVTTEDNKGHA